MSCEAISSPARQRPAWGKLIAGVLVLAALAAAWHWTPVAAYLTRENIGIWARTVGYSSWAPIAVVLSYTPAAFLLFPRPVLMLLTVMTFGTGLGSLYSALGILLAAFVTYSAGRLMRKERLRRIASEQFDEVSGVLKEHGVLAVSIGNMVPFPPFAVKGMIAGAIRINAWQYCIGSILGMTPGLLAGTFFARELRSVFKDPAQMSWWVVVGALVGFGLVALLSRRWLNKRMSAR
jgi:phospholipase D1/2